MVKKLATYLNSEVQRPTMQALEHSKGVRAELGARAKANSDLMSAEKRMVGPAQLNELRENLQRADAKAKQSLDEVRPPPRLPPRPFTQVAHPFFCWAGAEGVQRARRSVHRRDRLVSAGDGCRAGSAGARRVRPDHAGLPHTIRAAGL